METNNKREIEVLVERIKYLEGVIQDNVKDINPDDIKEWSEEEVISTIENKDNLIQHLKERIKDLQKGITIDEWYDQSDILEMRIWDSTLMDGLDDDEESDAVRSID
jgi:ribosomal protein S15P/S13E